MKNSVQLLTVTLLALSTVAVAATPDTHKATSGKVSCCEVADGCAKHSEKDIKEIDAAATTVDQARNSNDPKTMKAALELAYKSLNEIKKDETKNQVAMKALYNHLTKVEEKAKKLKADQDSLSGMLGDGAMGSEFIIGE